MVENTWYHELHANFVQQVFFIVAIVAIVDISFKRATIILDIRVRKHLKNVK